MEIFKDLRRGDLKLRMGPLNRDLPLFPSRICRVTIIFYLVDDNWHSFNRTNRITEFVHITDGPWLDVVVINNCVRIASPFLVLPKALGDNHRLSTEQCRAQDLSPRCLTRVEYLRMLRCEV